MTLLIALVFLTLIVLGMGALTTWVATRGPGLRNTVGFLLAGASSYSLCFVLDLWEQTYAGTIPAANTVAPSITWLILASACIVSAIRVACTPVALAVPFLLNAAIVFVAAAGRWQHLFVAVPLTFAGTLPIIVSRLRRSTTPAAPAGGGGSHRMHNDIGAHPDNDTEIQRVAVIARVTNWIRPVTYLAAPAASLLVIYLAYASKGVPGAVFWFVAQSIAYMFGPSPMLAVAASVLYFRDGVVGLWFPIISYVFAAILLYVDLRADSLKSRIELL